MTDIGCHDIMIIKLSFLDLLAKARVPQDLMQFQVRCENENCLNIGIKHI